MQKIKGYLNLEPQTKATKSSINVPMFKVQALVMINVKCILRYDSKIVKFTNKTTKINCNLLMVVEP
jgi:hypothetical protein